MRVVTLLECNPGNKRNAEGQPIFMITAANPDGSIETLSLDLHDTKSLITDALITLSEFNDEFAMYLLNEYWRRSGPSERNDWNAHDGFHDLNE
jgi:hypothetical protein